MRWVRTAAATLTLAVAAAGCGAGGDGGDSGGDGAKGGPKARFETGQAVARADTPVRMRLTGLEPGSHVRVTAHADDRYDATWASKVTRTADAHGRIDLSKDTGHLLSGMLPLGGRHAKLKDSGTAFSYHPGPPGSQRSYKVKVTATAVSGKADGQHLADRTLTRQWLTKGTTHRKLTVAKNKIAGDLYLPARDARNDAAKGGVRKEDGTEEREGKGGGAARKAPVLVFGGSEGGNAGTYTAALLASHGHPAMSVCYFRCGSGSGRPNAINKIDLDYFTHAGRVLRAQDGADPQRLAVIGNSRGSEVAQLLGQRRPSVFRDVVAYAPSSKAIGPYPAGTVAWTDHGRPIPRGPIPLDRVRGTVLAVAGGNDKMWGSVASAHTMAKNRGVEKLVYPDAGHHVNWFPFAQPGQEGGANGDVTTTSRADQAARADSWPKILKLLDG
ncbi:acyl-CoA thioesterase/BAAT N-terminal domain-containing protein [Streptomyces iconiensis]|uniref:Acyl-CoA thioesterase/BAAT N-terminal domain-containing protein n=1 Tax=Streptomyces iconiensis TaxID=1384038 RepID=A0ABT7AC77_9ACTN|nr:acyl-CoA thioesterase/BAAT N-terminal domain-containing protein [Streptomyces iconiensis]MDJ1138416.1 acyl-CoA thioesterase/BAAT N-terminal domain-containing protein [Streptomyces iconiensis]